jgi:hypothetical protein
MHRPSPQRSTPSRRNLEVDNTSSETHRQKGDAKATDNREHDIRESGERLRLSQQLCALNREGRKRREGTKETRAEK